MKKEYGQHFLADENILGVIGRLADLQPDDVVLEIGPGEGVLTRYLAGRVARVHAIEIDPELEPALRDLPGNVDVVFGDALEVQLPRAATKLVANLPYNVATPIVVESLDGLPNVQLWCVMVQREVADRFFAEPGTKAYGAVSVLVRLAVGPQAAEWFEQPLDRRRRYLLTRVSDGQGSPCLLHSDANVNPSSRAVVADSVVDQVRNETFEQRTVAVDDGGRKRRGELDLC